MLQKGMVVNVFHDPLTRTKVEGSAKLLREYRPDVGDGLSMWEVEFHDDPAATFLRTIYGPQEPTDG